MVEIVLEKLFTVSGWSPLSQLRLNGLYHSLTLLELNKCWFETLFVEMQFHLKAFDSRQKGEHQASRDAFTLNPLTPKI